MWSENIQKGIMKSMAKKKAKLEPGNSKQVLIKSRIKVDC
jgi:hypothetical protein